MALLSHSKFWFLAVLSLLLLSSLHFGFAHNFETTEEIDSVLPAARFILEDVEERLKLAKACKLIDAKRLKELDEALMSFSETVFSSPPSVVQDALEEFTLQTKKTVNELSNKTVEFMAPYKTCKLNLEAGMTYLQELHEPAKVKYEDQLRSVLDAFKQQIDDAEAQFLKDCKQATAATALKKAQQSYDQTFNKLLQEVIQDNELDNYDEDFSDAYDSGLLDEVLFEDDDDHLEHNHDHDDHDSHHHLSHTPTPPVKKQQQQAAAEQQVAGKETAYYEPAIKKDPSKAEKAYAFLGSDGRVEEMVVMPPEAYHHEEIADKELKALAEEAKKGVQEESAHH